MLLTDRVFHADSTTREVYEEAAKEVALKVLSGVNCKMIKIYLLLPFCVNTINLI